MPTIREKLRRLSQKSILNSTNGNEKSGTTGGAASSPPHENETAKKDIISMTTSEMRRNIGSVTYFLDPKIFEENSKTRMFGTREMWLPIKDITVTPTSTATISVSNNKLFGLL